MKTNYNLISKDLNTTWKIDKFKSVWHETNWSRGLLAEMVIDKKSFSQKAI